MSSFNGGSNSYVFGEIKYVRENFKMLGTNLKQPPKIGYFYVVSLNFFFLFKG